MSLKYTLLMSSLVSIYAWAAPIQNSAEQRQLTIYDDLATMKQVQASPQSNGVVTFHNIPAHIQLDDVTVFADPKVQIIKISEQGNDEVQKQQLNLQNLRDQRQQLIAHPDFPSATKNRTDLIQLNEKIQQLENHLKLLGKGTKNIVVQYRAKQASPQNKISLFYQSNGVNWQPLYEANYSQGHLMVNYYALITKRRPGIWQDLQVNLRTGQLYSDLPNYNTWELREFSPNPMPLEPMLYANAGGNARMAATPIMSTQATGYDYRIPQPTTLQEGQQKLLLQQYSAPTKLQYEAWPRQSNHIFLVAPAFTYKPFTVSGPLQSSIDGQLSNKGFYQIGQSIPLGVDHLLTMKQQREVSRNVSNDTVEVKYTHYTMITNLHPHAVVVKLNQSIPVSYNNQIEVMSDQKADSKGHFTQQIEIDPGKTARTSFSVTIHFNKKLKVMGLPQNQDE